MNAVGPDRHTNFYSYILQYLSSYVQSCHTIILCRCQKGLNSVVCLLLSEQHLLKSADSYEEIYQVAMHIITKRLTRLNHQSTQKRLEYFRNTSMINADFVKYLKPNLLTKTSFQNYFQKWPRSHDPVKRSLFRHGTPKQIALFFI